MRLIMAMTLTLLAAGCVSGTKTSGEALCDGSRAARADHAAALADTQDERVLMTGARLIGLLDAGCAK